jgi:phosphate-selective porin OprO and OprP
MRRSLPAHSVSAILLASASSIALAQQAPATDNAAQAENVIDEVVSDDAAAEVPPPAPTGDAVLDRLNALEARVRTLEARNRQLEDQLTVQEGRVQSVEVRAAKGVQASVAPTHADPNGQFSFKTRGVVDVDYASFFEREGGYDYNNGTAFRRARLGAEGTAFTNFNWRLEVDFAGNAVSVTDAYLQYAGVKPWLFTVGQHKAPFSLESNNSDNYNVFMERGLLTNAFGNVGAERRIGASAAYQRDKFTASFGVFGDNESISRSSVAPVTNTPDESWGFNGRLTWDPVLDTGKVVHLGASGFWRTALKSGDIGDAVRITERPNIRVDNGNIVDSGVITEVDKAVYLGAEAALVRGPFTAWGEYGRLKLERFAALSDPTSTAIMSPRATSSRARRGRSATATSTACGRSTTSSRVAAGARWSWRCATTSSTPPRLPSPRAPATRSRPSPPRSTGTSTPTSSFSSTGSVSTATTRRSIRSVRRQRATPWLRASTSTGRENGHGNGLRRARTSAASARELPCAIGATGLRAHLRVHGVLPVGDRADPGFGGVPEGGRRHAR